MKTAGKLNIFFVMLFLIAAIFSKTNLSEVFAQKATESSNISRLKEQISNQLQIKQLKVFGGEIKGILSNTITINTLSGTATIQIDNKTAFTDGKSQKAITLDDFEIDSFITATGKLNNQKALSAQQITLLADKKPPKTKNIIFGFVQNSSQDFIQILGSDKKNHIILNIDKSSQIKDQNNQIVSFVDLKPGQIILAIANSSKQIIDKAIVIPTTVKIDLPAASESATKSAN